MDKKYITNKAFSSANHRYYLPKDVFTNIEGILVDEENVYVCMVHSQIARDLNLTGNDDTKGIERYNLIVEIKDFLNNSDFNKKQDGIVRMFGNKVAMKYNQNAKDGGPWIWNDDFYCASLSDLRHIKNLLYNFD